MLDDVDMEEIMDEENYFATKILEKEDDLLFLDSFMLAALDGKQHHSVREENIQDA